MGCDIHAWIEVSTSPFSEWVLFEPVAFGRHYAAFGLMAGVRGPYRLFEPKGMPKDRSHGFQRHSDWYGKDAHSHSWLSLFELGQVQAVLNDSEAGDFRQCNGVDSAIAKMKELWEQGWDTRLVFFFDS